MTPEERLERRRERSRKWAYQWRIDNPELALAKDARRRAAILADPAMLERRRQTKLAWNLANPEKVRAMQDRRKERRQADPKLRVDNARRAREWREKNPDKHRALVLSRRGITPAQYDALLLSQDGVFAICHRAEVGRRLAIDHDHTTGDIRGLLCSPCNQGLGLFGDDTARLAAATKYLNHSRTRRVAA